MTQDIGFTLRTAPQCPEVYVHEKGQRYRCEREPGHRETHMARIDERGAWVHYPGPTTPGIVATDYWLTWDEVDPWSRIGVPRA